MKPTYKWGLVFVIGAGIIAAGATPWRSWDDSVRNHLTQQIRLMTGLEMEAQESVRFAVLPRPHIKIKSVRIKDRWDNLSIDVQILKGNLRLLPLLAGRLEVSSFSLFVPTVSLNIHGRPLHDRGAIAKASDAAKSAAQTRIADSARLATIQIFGGRLLLKSSSQSAATHVGDINATLDWHNISSPASFNGSFIWRGEKVELMTSVSKPALLLRGQSSPLTLALNSRLLDISLKGLLTAGQKWQYQGPATATSKAVRALLSVSGANIPLPTQLRAGAISGNVSVRAGAMSISKLALKLDGNTFAGTLAIRDNEKRPLISGTLATEKLLLDPRVAGLPRPSGKDGKWNRRPLPLRALTDVDLDLRLSAQQAQFGNLRAGQVALVVHSRNGRLEISVSSQAAYGGRFNAKLNVESGPAIPALSGIMSFSKIDTGTLLKHAMRNGKFSGSASGNITLRSAGDNFAEMIKLAGGKINVQLTQGAVFGINLEEGIRLAKTMPLSIPGQIRNGQTPFSSAAAEAIIKDGLLHFTTASLINSSIRSDITGHINLSDKQLQLTVSAAQKDKPGQSKSKSPKLDINVNGDWNRPLIVPNPEYLILRSKAAAPLLRRIKKALTKRSKSRAKADTAQ